MGGFFLFSSQTLLMDGLSTLLDMIGSLILVSSLSYASRPPDQNHPFGHGRLEPLVGFQIALVMSIAGLFFVCFEGKELLFGEKREAISAIAAWIPLVGALFLTGAYLLLKKQAKKYHSPILEMEARHYGLDSINSLLAAGVLFLGQIITDWSVALDKIGAIALACLMIFLGLRSMRENGNQLMDRIPEPIYFERVRRAAMGVSAVLGTEKTKIQLYGPDAHVAIDIEVDPHLQVDQAHLISQKVRDAIFQELPEVKDVIVHIEPYYPGDHLC